MLVSLPFFQIAESNRAEEIAGHAPKYGLTGILSLVPLALGVFAAIKLIELRIAKAGRTPIAPFSQAWLGIIVALFAVCILAIGSFPYVEWLHETLQVFPAKVVNATGATVELAGFSQVFVKHGCEFWEGRVIALISISSCALLLLLPRRLRWNVARSVMLLSAGVAIMVLAAEFEIHRLPDSASSMLALESQAKTDPRLQQFVQDFRRHKASQAADKNVPPETMEKLGDSYGGVYCEYRPAYGHAVCAYAALALMMLGVNTFRQTTKASPAAFVSWHRAVERWSSLLLLAPCLLSVLPVFYINYWVENVAWIPLFDGKGWFGDWVKAEPPAPGWRGLLAGLDHRRSLYRGNSGGRGHVAPGWKPGARAATLGLAGLISIACAIDFDLLKGSFRDTATISWDDFQAVAQHGAQAAGSAETRRFLAEHPRYVGQLVALEGNVQALAANLAVPAPGELPKKTVTKSADGKTTTTTISLGMPFLTEARKAQAQRLAQGGGVVSLYQNSGIGPLWPVLCGLGLVLLGIRDGYQSWKTRSGTPEQDKPTPGAPNSN